MNRLHNFIGLSKVTDMKEATEQADATLSRQTFIQHILGSNLG
jgi:hypothetical protein